VISKLNSSGQVRPLFAGNERLWLNLWGVMQALALTTACLIVINDAGGVARVVVSPTAPRLILTVLLVMVYHLAGIKWHASMMARPLAAFMFVPAGWVILLIAIADHDAFAVLVFGAVVQLLIFLPFVPALVSVALAIALAAGWVVSRPSAYSPSLTLARLIAVAAIGIMIGTVMLYLHRVNIDAAIRSRLLDQLDAAHRDLEQRARAAGVQAERQRIATDIHDTLAQGFTSVIKQLEAVELFLDAASPETQRVLQSMRPHLASAQRVSRDSLTEIRRVIWALRPAALDHAALPLALRRVAAQWSRAVGVTVHCDVHEMPALNPDAEVALLRVTQEALSNVARHADAATVNLSLCCVDGLILLAVEDDGRGFDDALLDHDGVGIAGMRERLRRLGGHLLIEGGPGKGTGVTAAVPISAAVLTP
jgi:signal transduction histidine kinase